MVTVNLTYPPITLLVQAFIGISAGTDCVCDDASTRCLQRLVSVATRETSPVIVYDETYTLTTSVFDTVVDYSHPLQMYEYRSFYSFLGPYIKKVMKTATLREYRSRLNFVLIFGNGSMENMMRHVTNLDNTVGQRSLLRHFSTWLIVSHDPPSHLNVTLDNVALIRVSQIYPQMEMKRAHCEMEAMKVNTEMGQKALTYQMIELYSLLWMPGRREWSHVQPCNQPNDQPYTTIFPNTQRGLNGRQLILGALEWRPHTKRHVKNGDAYYTGAGMDALGMLGRVFNFSYLTVEPKDMLWGRELNNGSWTGLTGMIQRAEVDTCPVLYGVSLRRKKAMDFTSPITATEYSAFYRRRSDDTTSWLYLLSCFSWQVYLCGSVSLLWSACLLVCVRKKSDALHGLISTEKKEDVLNCLEIGVSLPLRQAFLILPKTTPARIVLGTWCLFCLVMTSVYTGNVVAFTTVNKYNLPFTTLQELADQDEYSVGVLEGGYAETLLMTSNDPVLKSVYQKIVQTTGLSNGSLSIENVVPYNIQKVIDEKYVLIATSVVKNIIRSVTCDVVEMKEKFFPVHSSFAFPRYSPLKELFNEKILLLRELGIMNNMEMEWTPKAKFCDSSFQTPRFKLDNLKTVLVTCLAGILVAAVILRMEMLQKKN